MWERQSSGVGVMLPLWFLIEQYVANGWPKNVLAKKNKMVGKYPVHPIGYIVINRGKYISVIGIGFKFLKFEYPKMVKCSPLNCVISLFPLRDLQPFCLY
jgi:hypothetical protein